MQIFPINIIRLSTDSYIPIKLLYFGSKSYIFKHLLYSYKFSYILKISPIFLGKFVADEYLVNSSALILLFASLFFILYFFLNKIIFILFIKKCINFNGHNVTP